MFNGKYKAVTFSYDDGVTQDIRLIEIFNKYNLKATFNLNSELLGKSGALVREGKNVSHNKNKPEDIKHIYDGHEIAAHSLTHPFLPDIKEDTEVIRQVEEDRQKLSYLAGYEVLGMAYPCSTGDERTERLIRENTGIKYARGVETTGSFDVFENLFRYNGTIYHHAEWDKLFETGERFLNAKADKPQVFYIWGHAYEFDIYPERWEMFEEFCKMISGKSDVFYGTNAEVLLAKQ